MQGRMKKRALPDFILQAHKGDAQKQHKRPAPPVYNADVMLSSTSSSSAPSSQHKNNKRHKLRQNGVKDEESRNAQTNATTQRIVISPSPPSPHPVSSTPPTIASVSAHPSIQAPASTLVSLPDDILRSLLPYLLIWEVACMRVVNHNLLSKLFPSSSSPSLEWESQDEEVSYAQNTQEYRFWHEYNSCDVQYTQCWWRFLSHLHPSRYPYGPASFHHPTALIDDGERAPTLPLTLTALVSSFLLPYSSYESVRSNPKDKGNLARLGQGILADFVRDHMGTKEQYWLVVTNAFRLPSTLQYLHLHYLYPTDHLLHLLSSRLSSLHGLQWKAVMGDGEERMATWMKHAQGIREM